MVPFQALLSKAVANSHSLRPWLANSLTLSFLSIDFSLLIVKQLQFILMDLSDTDCNGPSTCDPAAGSCQPHWAPDAFELLPERPFPSP